MRNMLWLLDNIGLIYQKRFDLFHLLLVLLAVIAILTEGVLIGFHAENKI